MTESDDRRSNAGIDQLNDKLYAVREAVSVMSAKVEGLTAQVDKGFTKVDETFRDFNSRYATKEDLKALTEQVSDIRKNLSRVVWIVITAVIMAGLALIFRAGLLHA